MGSSAEVIIYDHLFYIFLEKFFHNMGANQSGPADNQYGFILNIQTQLLFINDGLIAVSARRDPDREATERAAPTATYSLQDII